MDCILQREHMISLIKEKPALWDAQSKGYKDKQVREGAWADVGSGLHVNWMYMEADEREASIKDMKLKWRHIRDNYVKHRHAIESGHPRTRKNYIYGDALAFLDKNGTAKRRSSRTSNIKSNDSDGEIEFLEMNDSMYYDPLQVRFDLDAAEGSSSSAGTKSRPSIPKKELNPPPIANIQVVEMCESTQESQDVVDPDRDALLSLLTDYKHLTRQQKIDFRIHALQFFRNVYEETADSAS